MFIPLHDANDLIYIKRQYVTLCLIAANTAIWLVTGTMGNDVLMAYSTMLGFTPALGQDVLPDASGLGPLGGTITYLSYAFLHGDIFHLGGNMLFLWVFGDNVEDAMGHFRFLVFYLLCAIGAALFHGVVLPASSIPLIGASGAIAGVVAAYVILHPRVKIWALVFARIPIRLRAQWLLGAWIVLQVVMFILLPDDAVSWAAHLGGIMTGALLVLPFKRKDQPILDRRIEPPHAAVLKNQPVGGRKGPWT
ncbi:rhomboid family intramembrane serine protease [Notoacmeibacter ruber]|uniref:Rhomboid family intramembrane serine protease n=1 Tax=Notoacmeibacter ruber TaxID=2670375 RepID=A0A3L7JCY5_9HYPH|nr:rhomboid family intramembrane serine protease [Notoacmeibacter ruber]RLQ88607.1 rhomboid family intramembrane serine protease [Notoacmeibacter ruber]